MQPQDPRRNPSVLSSLDGLAQPVQSQQQPIQTGMVLPTEPVPIQPTQAPIVQPTATDQDANLVPDELTDEIQKVMGLPVNEPLYHGGSEPNPEMNVNYFTRLQKFAEEFGPAQQYDVFIDKPYDFEKTEGVYKDAQGNTVLDTEKNPISIGWLEENPDVVQDMIKRGFTGAVEGNDFIARFNNLPGKPEQTAIEIPPQPLRGAKKYTEADIKDQKPDIQLAKDVTVKDTSGKPVELKEGENLTPYMMKDGRVVIQDGVASTISPSTLDQIEKNSYSAEVNEEFAPELKDNNIQELGGSYQEELDDYVYELQKIGVNVEVDKDYDGTPYYNYYLDTPEQIPIYYVYDKENDSWDSVDEEDYQEAADKGIPVDIQYEDDPIVEEYPYAFSGTNSPGDYFPKWIWEQMPDEPYLQDRPKWEEHTLPGGDNYREILVTSENHYDIEYSNRYSELKKKYGDYYQNGVVNEKLKKADEKLIKDLEQKYAKKGSYVGDHFDDIVNDGNLDFHIRVKDRFWDNKKVTFMEEMQSDYAKSARDSGMIQPYEYKDIIKKIDKYETKLKPIQSKNNKNVRILNDFVGNLRKTYPNDDSLKGLSAWSYADVSTLKGKYNKYIDKVIDNYKQTSQQTYKLEGLIRLEKDKMGDKLPYNPNIKNWRENAIKVALSDAVNNGSDILSWTNGQQQGDRYNLSKVVDDIQKLSFNNLKYQIPEYEVDTKYDKPFNQNNVYGVRFNGKFGQIYTAVDRKTNNVVGVSSRSVKDWVGKNLSNVVSSDLAKKIQTANSGRKWKTPEELDIGTRHFDSLYNVQIKNIVEKLTKQRVKEADMGIESKKEYYKIYKDKLGVGKTQLTWENAKRGDYFEDSFSRYLLTKKDKKGIEYMNLRNLDEAVGEYWTAYNPKTGGYWSDDIIAGNIPKSKIFSLIKQREQAVDKIASDKAKESLKLQPIEKMTPKEKIAFKNTEYEYYKNKYKTYFSRLNKKDLQPVLQQYIELTPLVKALVKGEKLPIKASGRKY